MASISFTDGTGSATLSNGMPIGGDRLANWTPRDASIGPTSVSLGFGRILGAKFRRDGLVDFELPYLSGSTLPVALRLKLHLMKGGLVELTTDNELGERWAFATLGPETVPSVVFADNVTREYTFGVTLREASGNVCNSGLSGVMLWGDDFCAWQPGDYEAFRADTEANDNYPPNPHVLADGTGFIDQTVEYGSFDISRSITDFVQTAYNGGHRMLYSTRRLVDTDLNGETWGPFIAFGSGVDGFYYDDFWMRVVCEFSEGFELRDDVSTDVFQLLVADGRDMPSGAYSQSTATISIMPLNDVSGNLELEWRLKRNTGSTTTGFEQVATQADLFDGTPKEIIMRCRDNGGGNARIEVWYGTAFGALTKAVDITPAYPASHTGWITDDVNIMGAEMYEAPTQDNSYGIIEWECGLGADFASASWLARLGA